MKKSHQKEKPLMKITVRYAKISDMRSKYIKGIISLTAALFLVSGCGKVSTMYYDAGLAYLENRQFPEAEENLRISLDSEAKTKECYRLYGIACLSNGKYTEAVDAFIDALHTNNGSIREIDYDINYYLGLAYEKLEQYSDAADVYSAIIAVRPGETESYYRRAVCNLHLGKLSEADTDFLVVTGKNPSDIDKYLQIFFAIGDAGYKTEAESYLKALLGSDRKISDFDIGRIYYYLGDYSNARVYLEKAKDFSNADTYLMLGKTYEAIGDLNYAGSLYSEYLNAKGNNAAVYNQLGVCRTSAGDYEGALTAFSLGLNLGDSEWTGSLMFNEAVTYEYLLDFNTAYDKMTEYLKKYPKDEAALHELTFLETRRSEETETPQAQ